MLDFAEVPLCFPVGGLNPLKQPLGTLPPIWLYSIHIDALCNLFQNKPIVIVMIMNDIINHDSNESTAEL